MEQQLQAFAKGTSPGNGNQRFVPHSASMITMGRMIQTPGMPNIGTGNSATEATFGDISMAIPTLTTMVPKPVGMGMLPASSGSDQKHYNSFMAADGSSNKMLNAPVLNNNAFSNSADNISTLLGHRASILQCQQGIGGISMGTTNQIISTIDAHGISDGIIPTPGSDESKFVGRKKASSVGMGYRNYFNISEQISGVMETVNTQLKNPSYGSINCGVHLAGDNQHLMNHTTELSNSSFIYASKYDNLQLQASSHQNVSQPQQQNLVQSAISNKLSPSADDGYAMNAADLLPSRNLYGSAQCGRSLAAASFNGDSSGLVSTNSIHVPGLPTKQRQQTQYNQQLQQLSAEGRGALPNQPALQPSVRNAEMKRQLVGRQHLLLYFDHASKCSAPECQCRNGAGAVKYKLWAHMTTCHERQCSYPYCSASQTLTRHYKGCRDKCCAVCGPVRIKLSSNRYTQSANPGAAESACDRTHDKLTPTKRRKIGPTSSSCTQWAVETGPSEMEVLPQTQLLLQSGHDSSMMKSDFLNTIRVKPAPVIVEQPLRSHQVPFQQNCVLNESTFRIPQADHGQIQEKQNKAELAISLSASAPKQAVKISLSASAPKQAVKETMQVEQEVINTRGFVGLPSEKEGLTQMQTQVFLPSGHDSDMIKIEISKTIEVNHMHDKIQDVQPPIKQRYIETALQCEMQGVYQMKTQKCQPKRHNLGIINSSALETIKAEPALVMMEQTESSQQGHFQKNDELNKDTLQNPHTEHCLIKEQLVKPKLAMFLPGDVSKQVGRESMPDKQEATMDVSTFDHCTSEKFETPKKPKVQAVSLIEFFNCEQIREHITGLRQWVGQSKAKAENNKAMECQMNEKICTLCNVGKLTFALPPLYCSLCPSRIKPKASYYFVGAGDTRHCICKLCYNTIQNDVVKIYGNTYAKSKLMKKKNEEVAKEEVLVQCDNCKEWQHNICALFNGKRNEEGMTEYTCPNCYIEQIERGVWKPLPQNAIFRAKDLPTTCLSDHIEQRLCGRLREEREERAEALGKSFEEVPGAEELAVRVVSSVDKILEVKKRFSQFLQLKDFPSTFPYKSKALLLFQTIEGVEICLFCMFVQEFGSDCFCPNQRRIYLSYLDSVKYFRPDVKTVAGEALRTFVFHEILIGYLEYSKSRGFASCYIWSSPPLEGDDYILNCHPEIQKTPKTAKLREWYLTMLRKASKEEIVVHVTNMYDYFFVSTGEQKAKVTAARLPYFDGDYFSDEAGNVIIPKFEQQEEHRQKHQNIYRSTTKRFSRAAAQEESDSVSSKDVLLMKKLGDQIYQSKKNFIMVHLQHACTHCCLFILCGKRWVCKQCKNFQLCDKCYELEQNLDERDNHPKNSKEKHILLPIEVTDVPADTKDKDGIMERKFFDTRHAFLSLCRDNQYQFDTLRRAKHSSMMVLYHLHNPTEPVFMRKCSVCQHDIKTGWGLHFGICTDCYQKDSSVKHSRRLTAHPSIDDPNTKGHEAHGNRVHEVQKMLLIHVVQCLSSQCVYQYCKNLKGMFRHWMDCKTGATKGCIRCQKMWYMLQRHARACNESECRVPRCMDLKQQWRSQNQMESQRRLMLLKK